MANELAQQMDDNIAKRVKEYLIVYAVIILFICWEQDVISLINKSLQGTQNDAELSMKIITSLISVVSVIAGFIMNLGRDIKLHSFIDTKIIKVRDRTGKIIQEEMIKAGNRSGSRWAANMKNDINKTMHVFYHFINKQDVLRPLAFTYWEQYFTNIYVVFFGTISIIIVSVFIILNGITPINITLLCLMILVVIGVLFSTRSVIRKMYKLPIQQIEEIIASQLEELKKEIDSRFGSSIQ